MSSGGGGNGVPDTLVSSRKIDRRHHRAKFVFRASGYANGFQCALVEGNKQPHYASCSSPRAYKNLTPGRYRFYVRSFNGAGDDPTPASVKFRI
jgi:hypothetical protein